MATEVIRYNDRSHLTNDAINEELSLMFEKGGMKKIIEPFMPQGSTVAISTRNIMIDEFYDHLGGDSILTNFLELLSTLKRVLILMRLWT